MNKPSFIYFDLDDTLLDHKKAEKTALLETKKTYEILSEVSSEKLTSTYHEINKGLWHEYNHGRVTREELKYLRFANTFKSLGLNVDQSESVGQTYVNNYRRYWDWVEGAKSVYDALAEKFEVGVLTNGFTETQVLKIEMFDFNKTAKHNVISEEVGYLKPHPKIFQHATELTGHKPEEILYVGDSFNSDIEGGSAFGWRTAWFTHEKNGNSAPAEFTFSDFEELKHKLID